MRNDYKTALAEYKRHVGEKGDPSRKELTQRNKYIFDLILSSKKKGNKIYRTGGMTRGEFSHKTNPLFVIDSNGKDTGMELTGGEGVYDKEAQQKIELALNKKDYKKVGKIIEYEINDWKRRGMYS